MISGSRISVEDTETALNTPDGAGQRLRLKNTGSNPIDLGEAGVTDGTGYMLSGSGGLLTIEIGPDDALFGISASGQTNIVEVLQT